MALRPIGSHHQPDEVLGAVAPPGAGVAPLLLPGVGVHLGGAPVGVPRPQGAVFMPHTLSEERQLAGIVRIYVKLID